MKLSGYSVQRLGDFVVALNDLTRKQRVNVCAYGGIDISIGEDQHARLEWDDESREYVFTEAL